MSQLTNWLSQLPQTSLQVPDDLPDEFNDKLQARFINKALWQLNDMAALMEAFVERHRPVAAGLALGPVPWQRPDSHFVARVCIDDSFNQIILPAVTAVCLQLLFCKYHSVLQGC